MRTEGGDIREVEVEEKEGESWGMVLSPFPAQQLSTSIDFHCQYLCCKYFGLYQRWSWAQTKHAVQVGASGKTKKDREKEWERATREAVQNAY